MVISACPNCSAPLNWNGLCNRCLLELGKEKSIAKVSFSNTSDPDEIESLSRSFPQLEILRLVGRGGMGSIYHARQTALDRDVAIKIIDRSVSSNPEFLERFEREAKALAKLSHPNIVAVYDFGRTDTGMVYLMMEYVHGLNLREAMNTMPIEHPEALEMVCSLCSAVNYAHSRGVIHRDIKPENILLGDDGSLKLADFGIARIFGSELAQRLTTTQRVLGTLHYLAPEQLESPNEVDHRVDNYALGVVFYELLTRKLPIGNFEPPSFHNPHVNTTLDAIVMKALARRPTVRFQTADELRAAIESMTPVASDDHIPAWRGDSLHHTTSASVPFQRDDAGGLVDVLGSLYAGNDGIHIEYRMRDGIFGQIRSRIYTVDIPWERILRVEMRCRLFSGKLSIVADTISSLQEFPGSEEGRIEIGIKKAHYDLADQIMNKVRQFAPRAIPIQTNLSGKRVEYNPTLAFALLFFAILNAGVLSISQVALASTFSGKTQVMGSLAVSVLLGPILLAQLITGLLHAITANRECARIGTIASMLPVTPVALLSIPFGLWARNWLGKSDSNAATPVSKSSSAGWGLTTTFFIRESKHARWISLMETTFTLFAMCGLGVYVFGYYPTKMNYRIVGERTSRNDSLLSHIQSRLHGMDGVRVFFADESQTRNLRFHINCWQYQRSSIASRLQVCRSPEIVCLAKLDGQESHGSGRLVSVVQDLSTPLLNAILNGNRQLIACSEPFELSDRNVTKTKVSSHDKIELILSMEGMERFQKWIPPEAQEISVGILVDGMVYGFGDRKSMTDRPLRFQWAGDSSYSTEAIQAAIRGPSFTNELELLD